MSTRTPGYWERLESKKQNSSVAVQFRRNNTDDPAPITTADRLQAIRDEMATWAVDPASLTYEEVESFVTNKVMNRVKKTKEYQRQLEQQEQPKKRGFWGTIWHGFKRAVSWVWEQFCKLMDVIFKATQAVVKFIWNNGGEDVMRTYVARELSKIVST